MMPFGLSNAPGTFQKVINDQHDVFKELLGKDVVAYLDDIPAYLKGAK